MSDGKNFTDYLCCASDKNYFCTLPPNHDGDHKAGSFNLAGDKIIAHSWPRTQGGSK